MAKSMQLSKGAFIMVGYAGGLITCFLLLQSRWRQHATPVAQVLGSNQKEYPEFKSLEHLQTCLSSDAAKASAAADGALNRARLQEAGLLGKTWPVRVVCIAGTKPRPPGAKTLHFIRHGQGFHNSLADFCLLYNIRRRYSHQAEGLNPYNIAENFDPPLTEIGRQQAKALQPYARTTRPEMVVVSPMNRALMTSNIAFAHMLKAGIPWIAHEGCREKSHGNACDYRRTATELAAEFPNVNFSNVQEQDPWLSRPEGERTETDASQAARAYDFMLWIRDRPETEIVVSTHSAWLFSVFNTVLQCQPASLAEWFQNGELRTVHVTFT